MVGENIKKFRKAKKITQVELAKMLGVTQGAITQIEVGITNPDIRRLTEIATILGVTIDELFGAKTHELSKIPIVGEASCGLPISDSYQGEDFAYLTGEYNHRVYGVIAVGDSMFPDIEDNSQVICDPTQPYFNGDMVHYRYLGESAIKVYFEDKEANMIQLVPINPSEIFKTKTFRLDDTESILELTIHKVIWVNKPTTNNRLARLKMIGRA